MIALLVALACVSPEPDGAPPILRLTASPPSARTPMGDDLAGRPLAVGLAPLPIDRSWEVLTPHPDPRVMLREAGEAMGAWGVDLAGAMIDGPWLLDVANTPEQEPLVRVIRERSGRAIDLEDFLYFLDDVLVAAASGRHGEPMVVHSGRARSAGILVHPDDIFPRADRKPHVYASSASELDVDEQPPRASFTPAADGDPPGPGWTMRYPNPSTEEELYAALDAARPASDFSTRIRSLLDQIAAQGGETYLASTVRRRERGYLLWGAFLLSRAKDEADVSRIVATLKDRNTRWKLGIPIAWRHPDGWEATIEAARAMAEAYDVVFATEGGARFSDHYDAEAADFVAIGLPRTLTLRAPDGAVETFDLSDPEETRDLSLSPELIRWVEAHFAMRKLESDYPHWGDR